MRLFRNDGKRTSARTTASLLTRSILSIFSISVFFFSTWNLGTSMRMTQFGAQVYTNFSISNIKDSDFVLELSPDLVEYRHERDVFLDLSPDLVEYRHERAVFQSILQKSKSNLDTCKVFGTSEKKIEKVKEFDTGVLPLPEFGVIDAIQKWLEEDQAQITNSSKTDNGDQNFPTCYLPPPQECDVQKFSVIFMSYNLERLKKLNNGIKDISKWSKVAEIVLVWNSEREILEQGKGAENKYAIELLQWNKDKLHPLRIFFALQNGLENNLMNRYHPSVKPSQEAMLFFDDDGPFFSELAMDAGFDLWKRNSDVQVGSFPRNFRFKSKRMLEDQKETSLRSTEYIEKGNKNVHPNDLHTIKKLNDETGNQLAYPPSISFCPGSTNDVLEYNFFTFPSHTAHMLLPSGSFLHRNYACFVWHPVFKEIHNYLSTHPTHPDDITVSTLVSQLSGRPPRTFPREVTGEKRPSRANRAEENTVSKVKSKEIPTDNHDLDQNHRKLLWQQKDWGNMREEAINSIIQYFGSVNQGSVGWCAGSLAQRKHKSMHYSCEPMFPHYYSIPWIREGGLGNDHC